MKKDIRYGKSKNGNIDYDRWIDLSELPHTYKGVDWNKCIGMYVRFKYRDIKGVLHIHEYNKPNITIKYNEEKYVINSSHLTNCKLGKILGVITIDFKINLGQLFKDSKRNMRIVEKILKKDKRGRSWKYYKYKCEICGNEDWIEESHLLHSCNCNVCTGQKALLGVNTIWDKARWIVDLGVSEGDAKKYTPQSNKKIEVYCPYCGNTKNISIKSIFKNKSIMCMCGDGFSYPEKFIFNMLKQLGIDFKTQFSNYWCEKYKYDFCFELDDGKYIVETHGKQHYDGGFSSFGGRTLEEEQENDRVKMELAIQNGIKPENYIVLDCRKSEFDWIVASIFSSRLFDLFDLSKIDFYKCEEFALGNLVKNVCDYKRTNPEVTTVKYVEIFGIHYETALRYLKNGRMLGWC